METMHPASNSSWLIQPRKSTIWTREENKKFELAIVIYDEKTPYRWHKVASMIPRKSAIDVINQYRKLVADITNIEVGLYPSPGYLAASFTFELGKKRDFDGFRKRGRSCNQERKKSVPWTEEEHRRFLSGLERHGKGDWRNISRNFVISKTPTQVASHAQKYFLRKLTEGKDKKRPSIHDMTPPPQPQPLPPRPPPLLLGQNQLIKYSTQLPLPKKLLNWNILKTIFDSIAYPQDIARLHGRAGRNICSLY